MRNNIIFDLYGTLVDIRTDERSPRLWRTMADFYAEGGAAYDPAELMEAYFSTVTELERSSPQLRQDSHEAHPEIQLEYVFRKLYTDRGVQAGMDLALRTGELFRETSMDYIRLYPGARELLEGLRAAGRRVWLLSNAQAMFTRLELRMLGIDDAFDGIYLSSDYGVKKPDSRFFRVLLDERHIDVSDAVMVGNDGACDIAGARALGLATLYIRSNISPDEPTPRADHILDHMDLPQAGRILEKI